MSAWALRAGATVIVKAHPCDGDGPHTGQAMFVRHVRRNARDTRPALLDLEPHAEVEIPGIGRQMFPTRCLTAARTGLN